MVIRPKINKTRHAKALVLTLAIFLIGIALGFLLTNARFSYIQDISQEQRLEYDSLQLQYLLMTTLLQDKNCDAASSALSKNTDSLEKARIKLENFMQDKQENYEILKRDYILSELRYWLLAKKTNEICKKDTLTLLYFYDVDTICGDCRTQGAILTYIKSQFKDKLLIFAIDSSFDQEPLVSILKETYNVKSSPTIVLEDETFEGFTPTNELIKSICSIYKEKPEICKNAM